MNHQAGDRCVSLRRAPLPVPSASFAPKAWAHQQVRRQALRRSVGSNFNIMKGWVFGLLLLGLPNTPAARATDTGDEVVIVYNNKEPESKSVADYYAQQRKVPSEQIFGFNLSSGEEMSRTEFRDALQRPLAKALASKKLWHIASQILPTVSNEPPRVDWRPVTSKIRYLVLCYGVPLKISSDPTHQEPGLDKLRPELRRNEAAVDSELAWLPLVEDKIPLAGPLRNAFYTCTNAALLHPTNGILMVTRLDGPTPAIARGLVDKALQAENQGLWGRAYFDIRNTSEPGYKAGDDWIRGAAEIARHLGYETVVDENPGTFPAGFPMSHIAFYAGWYDQDASGPFAQPDVEFMPGAFAYHLHSLSARTLRSLTAGWVGPLIGKGATASMGCVYEPYLSGTPDVAVFTARFLYNGFSFGEAAYACQSVLSWQTTVVGDPLYRPCRRNPEQLQDELVQSNNKLAEWAYFRLLDINLANGKPAGDCVTLLEQLGNTKHSAVLSEKLGDLYEALGKPSSAVHAYEQALALEPSPQQRQRLRLVLGVQLNALNRQAEAYEQYQKLLEEYPKNLDKTALFKTLLPLAQKLDRKADVEKYQSALNALVLGTNTPTVKH
jgi:uncharacterized protein (TIGR03790 family)